MLLTEYIHGHEFRDPSTYASFYYPPEGQDTEREQEVAKKEAKKLADSDAEAYKQALEQTYTDVLVSAEIGEVEDEQVSQGRDYYHYYCDVPCKLRISIPIENFPDKTEDEILEILPTIYEKEIQTEIEYDDVEEEYVTDTSVEIVLTGTYAYTFENDRDYDF